MIKNIFVAGLLLSPLLNSAFAQSPILIDFDDLTAPCDFSSAQPLGSEYSTLGVVFNGFDDRGAAALGECSGFGIPTYSSPNFAAFDPSALLANGGVPDALYFHFFQFTGPAPNRVRINVGGPVGTTVNLGCAICPWAIPECQVNATAVLGNSMQVLDVSAGTGVFMSCTVDAIETVGPWIVDDIELFSETQGTPIPTLCRDGIGVFILLIAALGILAIQQKTT